MINPLLHAAPDVAIIWLSYLAYRLWRSAR